MSRSEAVEVALKRGARLGVARADTAVANAQIVTARTIPNPAFSATYSKAVPKYHYIVDVPVDFPWIRQLRIRSAEVGLRAAQLRFQFVRATVALDADTTYTRAVAARERLVLSRRNARDADSLLHMVERRRNAGDASDMDVELARVIAGQQENLVIADSLTLTSALLDLQAVMGMTSERVEVSVIDSLDAPPEAVLPGETLTELAADLTVESTSLASRLQRRSVWSLPSVSFGFDYGDPDFPGLLPTYGVAIALPLFDRNKGPIAQADAERVRAVAELTLTRVTVRNQIARAIRQREAALARIVRHRQLIASANRVASLSLIAYREGASTLTTALESQRSARELLGQFIDDLANAWIATAELRALAVPPTPKPDP